MKAVVAPSLLAAGALSLLLAIQHEGRHPGAGNLTRAGGTRVEGETFPLTLVTGDRRDRVERAPRRIVSLTLTSDEILTRFVPPESLAAVSRFAKDEAISTCAGRVPPGAQEVIGLNPEGVIALQPDLVFVAHYTQEAAVRILGAATLPVVRLAPVHAFADVAENVRVVARAVGQAARGEALAREMDARIARVEDRVRGLPHPRVLYFSSGGYTTGARTLVDAKIRAAGAENAAATAGLVGDVSASLDLLVSLDPDFIVVTRWTADAVAPVAEVTESPAWRTSRAVTSHHVVALPAGVLTSESADAALGVEALAALIHPESAGS